MRSTLTIGVAVTIILVVWLVSRPEAQGAALPPMFAAGQHVVNLAGAVIPITAVHGEWIQIGYSDRYRIPNVTDPLTGNSLSVTVQWVHVPSGMMWSAAERR